MAKGKKTCKSCGKENALRALKCDCGAEFTIKKKEQEPQEPTFVDRGNLMQVHTPGTGMMGGKGADPLIPVMPEGFEISSWIEKCQIKGEKRGVTYTKPAFNYMARQIWQDKDELDKALALIAENFRKVPIDDGQI